MAATFPENESRILGCITWCSDGMKQDLPIGSMYGICANICGILMVNVTIDMAYIRIRHGLWSLNFWNWHFTVTSASGDFTCGKWMVFMAGLARFYLPLLAPHRKGCPVVDVPCPAKLHDLDGYLSGPEHLGKLCIFSSQEKTNKLYSATKSRVSVLDNLFPDTRNTKRDDYVISMLNRHS